MLFKVKVNACFSIYHRTHCHTTCAISTLFRDIALPSYLFTTFVWLSTKYQFVQDDENFMKVINQMYLFDIVEVVIKNFHEEMNQL